MFHVKKTLSEMPVTLELQTYYSWLEETGGLGEKVRCGLNNGHSFTANMKKGKDTGQLTAEQS